MIERVTDVPFSEDPASRYLPWTVGLLVFLATPSRRMLLSAASDLWRQSPSGTLTVQVRRRSTEAMQAPRATRRSELPPNRRVSARGPTVR